MISKSEAAEALRDAERVHRRTNAGGVYAKASPHLLLAGAIWVLGYVASGLTHPEQWVWIWVPLMILGSFGSYAIAYRGYRQGPADPAAARVVHASRVLWMIAAIMAFVASTFLLFQPRDTLPYLAFPALLMALIYVFVGSLGLPKLVWIGAGMFTVLIAGLVVGRDAIAFWVAAAGGGGLLLGGLWLRKG